MAIFEYPASTTVLYGEEIPPAGGNTRFSNMYTAHETLPQALKNQSGGRRSLFDKGGGKLGYSVNSTENPCASHPFVRTHPETGRKALFLGRRDSAVIQGLNAEEASQLATRAALGIPGKTGVDLGAPSGDLATCLSGTIAASVTLDALSRRTRGAPSAR